LCRGGIGKHRAESSQARSLLEGMYYRDSKGIYQALAKGFVETTELRRDKT
jgi:hypothetical protein